MPIRPFFDNIGSVLTLAVVNTLINTCLIGFSLFAVSMWGWVGTSISLLHCLIFSALISAVDPVAVISVFEEVHVNQMLYIIVFGESLLNDGVTVVRFFSKCQTMNTNIEFIFNTFVANDTIWQPVVLSLTFQRKSATKYCIRQIAIAFQIYFHVI